MTNGFCSAIVQDNSIKKMFTSFTQKLFLRQELLSIHVFKSSCLYILQHRAILMTSKGLTMASLLPLSPVLKPIITFL